MSSWLPWRESVLEIPWSEVAESHRQAIWLACPGSSVLAFKSASLLQNQWFTQRAPVGFHFKWCPWMLFVFVLPWHIHYKAFPVEHTPPTPHPTPPGKTRSQFKGLESQLLPALWRCEREPCPPWVTPGIPNPWNYWIPATSQVFTKGGDSWVPPPNSAHVLHLYWVLYCYFSKKYRCCGDLWVF